MTESTTVPHRLEPGRHRAALDLFRGALHQPPLSDDGWEHERVTIETGSGLVALEDDRLAGMVHAAPTDLLLPGGAHVPASWITRFAVRPGHGRRGIGTALIRAQLSGCEEPVALLQATEGGIYQRFGFGVGTHVKQVVVDRRATGPHPGVPRGQVEVLPGEGALDQVRSLHRAARMRPGSITRPAHYEELLTRQIGGLWVALHTGPDYPDGPDGFARYLLRTEQPAGGTPRTVLEVLDLHHRTRRAWAGLWGFLLGVELVDEVRAPGRPLDEPVHLLLRDPRRCRTVAVRDELWIRPVDVLEALRARRYPVGPEVVLSVADDLLPHNTGRYRIGASGVERTHRAAQLVMDAGALGALYLGGTPASGLAAAGRVRVDDEAALAAADRLFAADRVPWCGTSL